MTVKWRWVQIIWTVFSVSRKEVLGTSKNILSVSSVSVFKTPIYILTHVINHSTSILIESNFTLLPFSTMHTLHILVGHQLS